MLSHLRDIETYLDPQPSLGWLGVLAGAGIVVVVLWMLGVMN
jgi:hypothetical protein